MGTVSRMYPRAKKYHRCTGCERPIEKGERYHRWTGTSDLWPGLATAKECAECCERYGRPIPALASRETLAPKEGTDAV
jgi:hypothetical protein